MAGRKYYAQTIVQGYPEVIDMSSGSLLDHPQVLCGSCLGNACSHSNQNQPVLQAGGRFKHGEHLRFDESSNTVLEKRLVIIL